MKLFKLIVALVALSMVMTLVFNSKAQSNLPVSVPVYGEYVFVGRPSASSDVGLYVVDTYTGEWQLLVEQDTTYGRTSSVVWDPYAEYIAYRVGRPIGSSDGAIYSFIDQTEYILPHLEGSEKFHYPQSWSRQADQILYRGFNGSSYSLDLLDLNTNELHTLLSYDRDMSLAGLIPLPSNATDALFWEIRQAAWNPIHKDWIALQIGISSDTTDRPFINIAYNYVTGEMILIDNVLPDATAPFFAWHWSGELLVYNHLVGGGASLVKFYHNGSAWTVQLVEQTDDTSGQTIFDWIGSGNLGAGNLMLSGNRVGDDLVYYIAEIIDGEWHSTGFFRIPREQFSVGDSDWTNIAFEAENKELSCIFDQTLPPRLQVEQRGRVSTPSRLRAKPGTYSDTITQMPEGTEFDVIGVPECQNGYRWWQLRLDDGTIGYAAEADTEEYFLEPPSENR